jgi:hypothetical protein
MLRERVIACIDANQLPENISFIEKFGQIAGTFGCGMTEDGDGFHVFDVGARFIAPYFSTREWA